MCHHFLQDEVLLEFHVDDTANDREDTLVEMAFHVPAGNERWGADAQQQGADGEDAVAAVPAAKVRVGTHELLSAVHDANVMVTCVLVCACEYLCSGPGAWGTTRPADPLSG
jgi:hypothetical protein